MIEMGAFVKKIKLFITVALLVYSFNPIHSNNDTGLGKTGTLTAEEFNIIAEKLFIDRRFAATDFVPPKMVIGLLNEAIRQNRLETVKFLLNKGIDINLTDDESGVTPLNIAVLGFYANPAIVKLLLEAGANPNGKNDEILDWPRNLYSDIIFSCMFKTALEVPLHNAISAYRFDIAEILLDHGADINMQNRDGNTALHIAVARWSYERVKFLLNAGADRYIPNKLDWTPLDLAKRFKYCDSDTATAIFSKIIELLTNDSWFSWL